jgi:hypothetical protein
MASTELLDQVRVLRARGLPPKQIARSLGVRPAEIAPLVRIVAGEQAPKEPAVAGCWVSPGWSVGLIVDEDRDWPDREGCGTEGVGAVAVLLAREDPRHTSKVSVCGYLVDTYCLGVKNALGPWRMDHNELAQLVRDYFDAFDGPPVRVPVDLARHLVWGAVKFARGLGFVPHPDFEPAAGHLGELEGPTAIRFGRYGKPFYMQGPFDDPEQIMRTLTQSAGMDNFDFAVSIAPEQSSGFTA